MTLIEAWQQVKRINKYLYRMYGYTGNDALHLLMDVEMELASREEFIRYVITGEAWNN